MLAGCLAIASTGKISIKSPSDGFAAINGNLNDESFSIAFGGSLDTQSYTSMTKQLTSTSPTTNTNCILQPSATAKADSVDAFIISPSSPLPANVTLTQTHHDVNSTETSDCNEIKILQSGTSNSITLLPNSLATSGVGVGVINSANGAASSAKASSDTSGRSAALERAYVHDVYEHCEEPTGPIRPRIAQFLNNLEPGSVVCDVGCGSGRYLAHGNPAICTVGVDRCYRLSKMAREKGGEVTMCDNLELPFRDESFDAVLSLAVVHHFATTERRVRALRELTRILRIGGRVIITVWALEQRHRRFESQDVLIPWQPPKVRNLSCSDEEDDDSFLPPYHAYTEDSTNSSRSAGDGDSSSLSSSSPGESCYSFVRRAIQKLASGRRHPWFLDSWASKETKNDSSLDFEDVKDLPIELRRLEDFEEFHDPPLSAGLKSRSLGSILNPPPCQIVRSRSSVPSLGGTILHLDVSQKAGAVYSQQDNGNVTTGISNTNNVSPTKLMKATNAKGLTPLGRRPKLIKQKQSLCDEEFQLPENPFHIISTYNSNNNIVSSSLYMRNGFYYNSNNCNANNQNGLKTEIMQNSQHQSSLSARQMMQASTFLRKQSSLNEELMAVNRLREKERVRKRIQKQTSLNEAFLCRTAMLSKKLHVIRESFTKKMKTSTGSFERATKTGLNKLVQNLSSYITPDATGSGTSENTVSEAELSNTAQQPAVASKCNKYHHHHHHHHHYVQKQLQQQQSLNLQNYHRPQGSSIHTFETVSPTTVNLQKQLSLGSSVNKYAGPVTYCNNAECTTSACYCSTYHYTGCNTFCTTNEGHENKEEKARRHSRESGSDSSKDSSLQSDTSIESEDSFASVIFIPKPEQHQQQLNYQQQHQNSNSSSSNSSSSNGGGSSGGGGGVCHAYGSCCQHKNGTCKIQSNGNLASCMTCLKHQQHPHQQRLSSVPTSPLIMPCPPTPAHSPAAVQAAMTSPPRTVATVTAAMAILTPPSSNLSGSKNDSDFNANGKQNTKTADNRFNFDEAHIKQHANDSELDKKQKEIEVKTESTSKITRQTIKNLPPIPKFRKQQSLQAIRQHFPIVRRSSATSTSSTPCIPKLMSLELFNPATDDLDSDSSEASTPNSIDSVISTGKSNMTAVTMEQAHLKSSPTSEQLEESDREKNDEFDPKQFAKAEKPQYSNEELHINNAVSQNIFLNENDSCPIPPVRCNVVANVSSVGKTEQDFAEQLHVQLLRKIEEKNTLDEFVNSEVNCESGDNLEIHISAIGESLNKKRSNELRDLSAIREELRERRLMLANLSTQPSLQQSPTSSTSSLSSQTRSFTIHEENEEESDERSYSLQLYENCKISKINYKRNRPYNLNPETAYLLQDDGDIFAEEEEEEEEDNHLSAQMEQDDSRSKPKYRTQTNARFNDNIVRYDSGESEVAALKEENPHSKEKDKDLDKQTSLHNRQSTESWGNSNSSAGSLESPSQGGATTHHRYYHVFREGELDALINHHVANLHIVSSYYERASWCVVAEKVQVWTI